MNLDLCRFLSPSTISTAGFTNEANAGSVDPKEVAVDSVGGINRDLILEFSGGVVIDSAFLGAVSADVEVQLSADTTDDSLYDTAYATKLAASHKRTAEAPFSYYWQLAGDTVYRLRFRFVSIPAGFNVGLARAAETFSPTYGHEWGAGRSLVDTGAATRNKAGGFGIEPGAIAGAWDWTLGDLTDEEVEELYDILRRIGATNPCLVVEDPAETNHLDARIHYGLFQRLEKYERRSVGITRWSLKIEEWI